MVSRYAHLAPGHLVAAVERLVSALSKVSRAMELSRNYPETEQNGSELVPTNVADAL
jgi:hypothetical protein